MTHVNKHLLLSLLVAASAAGPVYANVGNVDEGKKSMECSTPASAGDERKAFATDPKEGADRHTADRRFAATSPIPWQPGNPFRDDTAG